MPRFVLLYHHCPPHYERPLHWDLMLEAGAMLRTWALPQLPKDWRVIRARTDELHPHCPPLADDNRVAAEQLGDHRLDYLHKEGPLRGDRGEVMRIDRGTYESIAETANSWTLTLAGGNWSGRIVLEQTGQIPTDWTLQLV